MRLPLCNWAHDEETLVTQKKWEWNWDVNMEVEHELGEGKEESMNAWDQKWDLNSEFFKV